MMRNTPLWENQVTSYYGSMTCISLSLRLRGSGWVSVKPGTLPEHPGTPPEHPGTFPEHPWNSPEQPRSTPGTSHNTLEHPRNRQEYPQNTKIVVSGQTLTNRLSRRPPKIPNSSEDFCGSP